MNPLPDQLESITPVVLVGGRSKRFGRNKLLEPLGNGLLIDRPIAALRLVFARTVCCVGACDAQVAVRADRVIDDPYPGVGPLGGVLAALEHAGESVFVLPGDVPRIDAVSIRAVLEAARDRHDAWCVCARTGQDNRVHPTIGVYGQRATGVLRNAIRTERYGLYRAIPPEHRALVTIDARAAHNINELSDLEAGAS